VPTLIELRNKIEGLQEEEARRFLAKLQHLSAKDRELVEQFGVSLVKKILHDPTTQIKKTGGAERAATLASSLRYLFRLDTEEELDSEFGSRGEGATENRDSRDDDA
jgi:glutamyl-tRNA reductase